VLTGPPAAPLAQDSAKSATLMARRPTPEFGLDYIGDVGICASRSDQSSASPYDEGNAFVM